MISVVIPVFKVEAYLRQCVESVLAQSCKELEILLIDDASPDGCPALCDALAARHPCVRAIHKQNEGVGEARNTGIREARGDYIAFVDGDDALDDPRALETMLESARRTGSDIVVGNYRKMIGGANYQTTPHGFTDADDPQDPDFRFRGFFSVGHLSYVWCKLYRRSFLLQGAGGGGLWMQRFIYAEDRLFNLECWLNRPVYSFVDASVYLYRCNEASVSHTYKENFAEIWMGVADAFYESAKRYDRQDECFDVVAFTLFFSVFFSSKQEYVCRGRKRRLIREELKRYTRSPHAKPAFHALARGKYLREIRSGLWKLMIRCFSVAYDLRWYGLLALGISLLIRLHIDGRLSSTGKRSEQDAN